MLGITGLSSRPVVGRPQSADSDPAAIDKLVRRVRWLGAALCAIQFTLYSPPPGHVLPYSRWWGALPALLLISLNVMGSARKRLGKSPSASGWTLFQLVSDSAIAFLVIAMFTFDDSSALWALLIIPVLEASTRGWRGRALVTFAALCAGYIAREVVASVVYPYNNITIDSVTYRLGVLGIVAASTAGLAGRLTAQIVSTAAAAAEADQLRAVALATRRMSSLDVPTVIREVTLAAEAFGYTSVHVRSKAGAFLGNDSLCLPAQESPEDWFQRTTAATEAAGYAVLDEDDAGMPLGLDQVLVVADVTTGDSVEALLVGRHLLPLTPQQLEGLTLLAGQASAALANARRYEEGRAFEERLAFQATHDALTGLPNRTLLRDRASASLARSKRNGTLVAIMFIDLDRFKEINDVLGHAVGDALLQGVADRIALHLREEDTCARVGGDEFVVLAGDQPSEQTILDLAQRLRIAMHEPFQLDDICLDIEASVGVAWAPEHGDDVDGLLRHADVAMYAAKSRRESVVVYREEDDRLTPMHLATLGDLRRALDGEEQLSTHFQPIISLTDERLVGVEALIRWDHPTRGRVAPDDFIGIAEGTALIHRLTDHVLDLALTAVNIWANQGIDIQLAVNLSTRTLLDNSLSQRVESLLNLHGIAPHRIRLEITESALLADPTRAIATMRRLTALGVRLSIDDFGTGYSSMSHLRSLPVDEIKIDRSFVSEMLTSPNDFAMVRSVIDLAHSLQMRVVAEGVEDGRTLNALRDLGCDMAQGFFLGRPMPKSQFFDWASERRSLGFGPNTATSNERDYWLSLGG